MKLSILRNVGKFVMAAFVAVAMSTTTTGCSQKRCGNCPSKCAKPCDKDAATPCGPGCTKPCCKKADSGCPAGCTKPCCKKA